MGTTIVERSHDSVTFAASGDVKLAEWAIVISSPLDFRNSVSLGIVSGLRHLLMGSVTEGVVRNGVAPVLLVRP